MSRVTALPRAGWAALAIAALIAGFAAWSAAAANGDEAKKVRLCHAEGGPRYVSIEISKNGAINGHAKNHSPVVVDDVLVQGDCRGTYAPSTSRAGGHVRL